MLLHLLPPVSVRLTGAAEMPGRLLQLFWRNMEAFPDQPRDVISPSCPEVFSL